MTRSPDFLPSREAETVLTYSESAEGVMISRRRAMWELERHGLCAEADRQEFLIDCGDLDTYDAGDVLRWLGY